MGVRLSGGNTATVVAADMLEIVDLTCNSPETVETVHKSRSGKSKSNSKGRKNAVQAIPTKLIGLSKHPVSSKEKRTKSPMDAFKCEGDNTPRKAAFEGRSALYRRVRRPHCR